MTLSAKSARRPNCVRSAQFPIVHRPPTRSLMATTTLASTYLIMAGVLQMAAAQTLPTGGTVAGGNVSISQPSANRLEINQYSGTAITNWQSFSIGAGNSVNVVQPSTSASMLARVTGNTTSTIAGSLTATGQLMLVNPNGISITPTGTVNAGSGFVATTLGISNDDFLAGKRTFAGNGTSNAVTNAGTITVGPGGYAALIGGTVANSGTISVPAGKVGLGSGEIATLDFSGDGFLQVGVPTNAPGTGALVTNSGKIVATGGSVQIKAAAARDAARQAINMSGVVAARSVSGTDGNITLDGGDGTVAVSGKLNASSRSARGGNVTVTGRDIKLTGAKINASGKLGGGTVRIGGDEQGKGTLAHAATTTIDSGTTIHADATATGTGGTVVVWSDAKTTFNGWISAKGGATRGDGGSAEVSSHGVLAYTGATILTAPMGKTGTLLLDPYNVTISNGNDATSSGFTASDNDSVIKVTTLQTALASANVTVSTGSSGSQAGDITIAAPLTWSANLLRLDAAHSIKVASTVTVGGTGALMLNTNVGGGTGGDIDFGLTSTGFAGRIDFTGTPGAQALFFNMAQQTLIYSLADLQNINSSLSGNYALAGNLDATGTTYVNALIGSNASNAFTGTFEGLGHTIANLTINDTSFNDYYVGLIGYMSSGTVRDIGLPGGSVAGTTNAGALVGYFAGSNGGVIANAYATGSVTGGFGTGGLVGYGDGGTITNSYATGAVSGGLNVGGLVGYNSSAITNSYAMGTVSGSGGTTHTGGLVGQNDSNGTITNSYATGAVSGSGGFSENVGGLVGYNLGAITNAYATGAAFITSGYSNASFYAGGLVGNNSGGAITNAYATGAVSATGSGNVYVGGLVGYNISAVTNAYWDEQTAGSTLPGLGFDGNNQSGNVIGLTTAQFQNGTSAAGLGGAFTVSTNLYPYLTSFYPNGVQAISGIAYADSGVTLAASNGNGARYVYVDVAGKQTAVTTGANGYYYVALANGTLSSANGGTAVVAYTRDGNVVGPVSGAYLTTATGTTQNADIWAHTLIASTSAANLSTTGATAAALLSANSGANQTLLTAAAGTDTVLTDATSGVAALGSAGYIATSSAGFTIDQGISPYGLYARTTSGPITVSSDQTLGGPINLTLVSSSDINLNAAVQVNGNGAVNRAYGGALNVGLRPSGFIGSLTFANADGTAATSSQGGTLAINGTAYTLLYSMADVANVNTLGLAGQYALAGNLDATGTTYTTGVIAGGDSSGNSPTPFSGTFEGLGHTVANLTITGSSNNFVGLFGTLTGTINNIGIIGGSVTGSSHVASLVGQQYGGTINDAYTTAAVSGSGEYIGGLVGVSGGTISNAYATGAVTGGSVDSVGGLVGASSGAISSAYATGAVTGSTYVGGLVGQLSSSTISNAYATGAVTGTDNVGGLVGDGDGLIINAYATGAVTGHDFVGGLFGGARGTISNVYAMGEVSGHNYVGGLIGVATSMISNAYATGAVSGTDNVGGFAGIIDRQTTNVYATGAVIGSGHVGGLAGFLDGTISNAYATGAVSGSSQVGGLVGVSSGTISNAYWDTQTAGPSLPGIGSDNNNQSGNITGLMTAQMQDPFTFINAGWDFATVWGTSATGANGGKPMLRAFSTGLYDDYVKLGSGTRVYGDANSTISGATLSGVGTGNVTFNWGSAVGLTANAGTYNYADASVVSLSEMGSRTAYLDTSGTLTISPRALTVTADAQSKTYGDTSPLTYTVGGSGLVNGDTLQGSLSGVTGTSGVGTYAISQGGVTNTANPNYSIAFTGATATVTARPIAVTADAQSRAYGDANPALSYNVGGSGLVNGDQLSGSLATTATTASELGPYAITQGTLAASANYALTYTGANVTVTARPITVTADAQSRAYGDANPNLSYTASGLINGDTLAGALTTAATATSNVDAYAITQGSLAASSHYTIVYNGANLTVTPRALTVTADAQSRGYGNANPALTYTASGLINGDTLSGSLTTAATATSTVGSYAITQGSLGNANYAISYAGANLAVTPRSITVAIGSQSHIYGDTSQLSYTVGGAGLINGDVLAGSVDAQGATAATANVGSYAIGQGTLANPNYTISSFSGGTITITPRAITIAAGSQSRAYGDGNAALGYSVGGLGLVNGDTLTGAQATTATATSGVGTYAITQGSLAASSNYVVTSYTGGTLVIVPRAITVTANALSRAYGDANPALTYSVGGLGLVNGDTLSGTQATTATRTSSVGSYAITQGSLAASSNYVVTSYTGGSLTIAPRAITVTADALSRIYGNANPALTYTVGGLGLVNGDLLTGQLATDATRTSLVGQYVVTQGTLTASNNYAQTFQAAFLTVIPNSPPASSFGNTFGAQGPGPSNPGMQPSGSGDDGSFFGFTSAGYDTPSACTGGRACASQ